MPRATSEPWWHRFAVAPSAHVDRGCHDARVPTHMLMGQDMKVWHQELIGPGFPRLV